MSDEGIEINDEVLNGGELLFDSSFIQLDGSCLIVPTEDEPDIVQLPDAADAGIGIATDDADTDFQGIGIARKNDADTDFQGIGIARKNDADTDFQGQAGAVASKMKKKKCAMALVSLSVLFAFVVALGVGLGTKNGNKSVSSANNAVTLEDCLEEEKAREESTLVPTWMSTTLLPSYEPMALSLSEETGEEEESAAATIGASPMGYSNDFAGTTMDVQESDDGLVRRDLRGSSSAASKVHEMKASSKSRRLQCDEFLADHTSTSVGGSSKSGKSTKSSKGSKKGTPPPSKAPCVAALADREELAQAVTDYIDQDCKTNSTCAIGATFGWPIDSWCVENVTSFYRLFNRKRDFNETISSWKTSQVTDMSYAFDSAESFNQPLADWDTSGVTNMLAMFISTDAFNQPIGNWDTSGVTNMAGMFRFAKAFNQPIADWNTLGVSNADWGPSVKHMEVMFFGAFAFNQNLCPWGQYYKSGGVVYADMFRNSGCPSENDPRNTAGPWCANCPPTETP